MGTSGKLVFPGKFDNSVARIKDQVGTPVSSGRVSRAVPARCPCRRRASSTSRSFTRGLGRGRGRTSYRKQMLTRRASGARYGIRKRRNVRTFRRSPTAHATVYRPTFTPSLISTMWVSLSIEVIRICEFGRSSMLPGLRYRARPPFTYCAPTSISTLTPRW